MRGTRDVEFENAVKVVGFNCSGGVGNVVGVFSRMGSSLLDKGPI